MRLSNKTLIVAAVLAALPLLAQAESTYTTGTGSPITAAARVDFQITVPKILFLQVGTGAAYTTNPAVNLISFAVPAANVGDGSPISATAGSGDLGTGTVTARLLGNNGNITLTSTTLGPLNNGAGDTISYAQISTATGALGAGVPLPAPALADGATTTTTVTPAAGKIVNRDARWTYSYLNSTPVAPGTYGGVNVNNSRVTYTASMP